MNIEINIEETATELARKEVEREYNYDAKKIYERVSDNESEYTTNAQKIFDVAYDNYYDLLLNLKN
jgi:hypothetical protein